MKILLMIYVVSNSVLVPAEDTFGDRFKPFLMQDMATCQQFRKRIIADKPKHLPEIKVFCNKFSNKNLPKNYQTF